MNNHTVLPRCTTQRHNGRFCDAPSMEDAPFPICFKHAYRLFRHMADTVKRVERDDIRILSLAMKQMDEAREREAEKQADAVVYYVQVGELCKIGTTTNLRRRIASYPPNRQLLATEPGGYALEAERHREFNDYLAAGREWFTPGPKLRAHIEGLADYRAA